MSRSLYTFLFATICTTSSVSAAEETYESPRSLGMGSALRGAAAANAALYTNPAGLASTKLFHLEAAYQYQTEVAGHAGHASVVDSTTPVAGGFGATYLAWDPDHEDVTGYDLRLTLALPAGDMFFFGATGKYVNLDAVGVPADAAPDAEPGSVADGITFDAGLMFRLGQAISFGVSGYNLRNVDSDVLPIGVGGGVGVAPMDLLLLDFDVVFDFPEEEDTAARYLLGVEYFAAGMYPIRVGYRFSEAESAHDVTAGLGYVDPRFGIDLGGRRRVGGGNDTVFGVALRVFAN